MSKQLVGPFGVIGDSAPGKISRTWETRQGGEGYPPVAFAELGIVSRSI